MSNRDFTTKDRRESDGAVMLLLAACFSFQLACGSTPEPRPPNAPVIGSPAAGDEVRSPLMVTGEGEAKAEVMVSMSDETALLGEAASVVAEDGEFEVELTFSDRPIGASLLLEVTVKNEDGASEPATISLSQGPLGNRYSSAHDAPLHQGDEYTNMQIYCVEHGEFLDATALLESLDEKDVVYVGEQHGTPAIHEMQLWLLELMTSRHTDVALAMEHFQAQNQNVLDDYLEDRISGAQLRARGDAWEDFELHWQPLVDHMKTAGRPVIATNVPGDALQEIYANGLSESPLDFFNAWDASSPYDPYLPPRPIPQWDELYQAYFETGFVYSHHGESWGLSYEEALDYFTDLSAIRDHTMGYWIGEHVEASGDRVVFVGGDWHVRTGIATPDLAAYWNPDLTHQALVTTSPRGEDFEELRESEIGGRKYADFILVYE